MALLSPKKPTILIPQVKAPAFNPSDELLLDMMFSTTEKKKSGGSSSSSKTSQKSDEEVLSGYVDQLYSAYKPEKLTYVQRSADELSKEISAWLRPTYDAAIAAREKATDTYRAELDADAIARGMGASTYVTDVKSRQLQQEAADVAALETDYAAQLAKQMSAALETEQQRAFETDLFNAEAANQAYQKAYSMALSMYQTYLANKNRGRSSPTTTQPRATTPENCELFLSNMTPEERKAVYYGETELDRAYRDELVASVGKDGLVDLYRKYPPS